MIERIGWSFLPVEDGALKGLATRHPALAQLVLYPPLSPAWWPGPASPSAPQLGPVQGRSRGLGRCTKAPLRPLLGPGCIYSASVNRRCLGAHSAMTTQRACLSFLRLLEPQVARGRFPRVRGFPGTELGCPRQAQAGLEGIRDVTQLSPSRV